MMHKIYKTLCALTLLLTVTGCGNDTNEVSPQSIFDTSEQVYNDFERWIMRNFTIPYNMEFSYLYSDKLSDNQYNVVPATRTNAVAMAILLKHVWTDAYTEVGGADFLKYNTFRQIQLIGSAEYDHTSIVLGTAEGGLKVILFRVNELDLNDIYINQDNPYREHQELPLDLNYWFFHTMHHEYCHILNQRKVFPTDFQVLANKDTYKSANLGQYRAADWANMEVSDAPLYGFVSNYASMDYNEDFAEVYSYYVTNNDTGWQKVLDAGIRYVDADGNTLATPDQRGKQLILEKLELVRTYFKESWNLDLEKLRAAVLRRSAEAGSLDLKTLD